MNRRGFIRSAAGVMASVLAGKALVPAAPTIVSLPTIPIEVCHWKPITLKMQTLTGPTYLTRDLLRDMGACGNGYVSEVSQLGEAILNRWREELA